MDEVNNVKIEIKCPILMCQADSFETKALLRKHLRVVHRRVKDVKFKKKEMKGAQRPKSDPEMLQIGQVSHFNVDDFTN